MEKVMISNSDWRKMVMLENRLIQLHNKMQSNRYQLAWQVSPYIGMFSCTLFEAENEIDIKAVDRVSWYADLDKGHGYEELKAKIEEWEKTYGSAP